MLLRGARILMIHKLGPSSLYSLDLYLQTVDSAVDSAVDSPVDSAVDSAVNEQL